MQPTTLVISKTLISEVLHRKLKAFLICVQRTFVDEAADRYSGFLFVEAIRRNYVSNLLLTQANLDIAHNITLLRCLILYCLDGTRRALL